MNFHKAYGSLLNRVPCVPCVPTSSTSQHTKRAPTSQFYMPTCQCANKRANVPMCQTCANYSTWRINIPKVCQFSNLTCERAKRRANFSFWHANLPNSVPVFLYSFYEILREISILYYYIKKSYIILDIIIIHMICVCIVHKKCIILHSILQVILKKGVRHFCFLKVFCSLV